MPDDPLRVLQRADERDRDRSLPAEAFVRTKPPRFFGDWVDTEESQRLLQYQKRGLNEQLRDMRKDFGVLVPLIRLLRPLATWFVPAALPT